MAVFLLALAPSITTAANWVLAGLAANIGYGAADELKDFVIRKSKAELQGYVEQFIASTAKDMGLELSEDGNLTDESLTGVANKLLAGTGVKIDSLLDRDRLKSGLEKQAIEALAQSIGMPVAGGGISGVRVALQQWAVNEVTAQLVAGGGAVFDAAKPDSKIGALIVKAEKKVGWNVPTDMSDKGVDNRRRQAKYRARHKKQWVEK